MTDSSTRSSWYPGWGTVFTIAGACTVQAAIIWAVARSIYQNAEYIGQKKTLNSQKERRKRRKMRRPEKKFSISQIRDSEFDSDRSYMQKPNGQKYSATMQASTFLNDSMQLDASNFSDSGDYETEEADQSIHGSTWNVDEHFDFQTFHEESENEQDKSDESPRIPEEDQGGKLSHAPEQLGFTFSAPGLIPSDRNIKVLRKEESQDLDQSLIDADKDEFLQPQLEDAHMSDENKGVCRSLREAVSLRKKYLFVPNDEENLDVNKEKARPERMVRKAPFAWDTDPPTQEVFEMVDGVMQVFKDAQCSEASIQAKSARSYFRDLHILTRIVHTGPVKSFCHHRLNLLDKKYSLHRMLNASKEFYAQKKETNRDFYNVHKVDTHVHHSSCMNQKHLLKFMKYKLRKEPHEFAVVRNDKVLTLAEVFESLQISGEELNIDMLDMHASTETFHRFDRFNAKYNPMGAPILREIFLKYDNAIHGKYLADLTKEVFDDLRQTEYQSAEYRISIYGRNSSEWDSLAGWIVGYSLQSENVAWMVQIPRLFNVYKEQGLLSNFQAMLDNIFQPLFEVTKDPSSHPQLHLFLKMLVGFDMVDDESKPDRRDLNHVKPENWIYEHNPSYAYWTYYLYANLYVLNKFRESKGLNTFSFRPHCGEAGDPDHLACAFLTAHNIAHGLLLKKSPALQYLYYLSQIGLSMSPLSNNRLFLDYHKNPFPEFFGRGLNVCLSTDDPLQIHLTKEPLVEEYSVAAQVWKLSSADLCEIARNSILQSGFHHLKKMTWLGENYLLHGPAGNDTTRTNVPNIRIRYRDELWDREMRYVFGYRFNRPAFSPRAKHWFPLSRRPSSIVIDDGPGATSSIAFPMSKMGSPENANSYEHSSNSTSESTGSISGGSRVLKDELEAVHEFHDTNGVSDSQDLDRPSSS